MLTAPNAALRFHPASGAADAAPQGERPRGNKAAAADQRAVYVLRGTQAVKVPVKVGLTDGTVTEIMDGDLHQGDAIITDAAGPDAAAAAPRPSAQNAPPRMRL